MIPTLRILARNTLIRDVLFCEEPSPLLQHCNVVSTNHLNFELQFMYNDFVFDLDDACIVPRAVSDEILSSLCEFCPTMTPEWAVLNLVHSGTTRLSLSNFTNSDKSIIQLPSLLYKLFTRCQNVKELCFTMMDIAPGMFTHCILPKADQYTSISLSCCMTVRDMDVTMLLESCHNLTSLNLTASLISDEAFVNVHPKKITCSDCGNKSHNYLKLAVVNISECSKLTTKCIRKLVELCGPSLKSLFLNQCNNMYTTALWYLCGLFKGKDDFLVGNFAGHMPLSCCCNMEETLRHAHTKTTQTLVDSHSDVTGSETVSGTASGTNDQAQNLVPGNLNTSPVAGMSHIDNVIAGEVISQHMSALALADVTIENAQDELNLATPPPNDNTGPETAAENLPTLAVIFDYIGSLCDGQCSVLEAFLRHTAQEEDPSTSTARYQDCNVSPEEGIISEPHFTLSTIVDCRKMLCHFFDQMGADAGESCDILTKIIYQEYDDVEITAHKTYQNMTKAVIVSAKNILLVLDNLHQIVGSILAASMSHLEVEAGDIQETNTNNIELGDTCSTAILLLRQKLVHYVKVLGLVSSEIKRNELLRLRLAHSLEMEAMQREELIKIRDLHNQLSVLHERQQVLFRGIEQINRGADGIYRVNMGAEDEGDAVDDVQNGAGEEPAPEDEYDEQSPELINLLRSEVKLLLQHAQYSHCPSCCMNAYTPQLEELDICDIKYQSEELALLTLKGFVTVNKGLKLLNISWSCIDNETIEYVAKECPDLKALSVQQCNLLSSPFLEYFSNHDLRSLDTLGISWLHDSDILYYLGGGSVNKSALTTLCLAESNVTDISLVHLSKGFQLKHLNLSWCDDVTDYGLSVIISSQTSTLDTLLIRQCAIGTETLRAIGKCASLTQLDISTTVDITDDIWSPLAVGLPLLTELDISWVYGIDNAKLSLLFTHCPMLKKLTVDGHKLITTELFDRMFVIQKGGKRVRSAQYLPNLRYISLQYCNDMDDDALMCIVLDCRGSLVVKSYYGEDLEYHNFE